LGEQDVPPRGLRSAKLMVDLANDLLRYKSFQWDKLSPRLAFKLNLNKNTRIAEAKQTILVPPPRAYGYFDIFVDDIKGIVPAIDNAHHRFFLALLTAVDATCRLTNPKDDLHRDDALHLGKTLVEGDPAESFMVLGWVIDLRRLKIHLPRDKLQAWTHDIDDILSAPKITKGQLETLVGRLQNAPQAIPMANYFLQQFYQVISGYHNPFKRRAMEVGGKDLLRLWLGFLNQAAKGISLNLLTTRRPTTVVISDACPTGRGGGGIQDNWGKHDDFSSQSL
jgi:hypothetical protein